MTTPPVHPRAARLVLLLTGTAVIAAGLCAAPAGAASPPPAPGTTAVMGAAVTGAAVTGAAVSRAAVTEVYPVLAGRVLTVDGRGYGHGRGLSQWGAQGAATLGKTSRQILDAYYPGTSATTLAASSIRIALTHAGAEGLPPKGGADGRYECDAAASAAAARCVLEVVPADRLTAGDDSTGAAATLPTRVASGDVRRWRVVPDATGLRLQALTGTQWTDQPLGGRASVAGPVTFGGTNPSVRYLDGSVTTYRGTVSAVRTGATRVARINTVDLEHYLYGVVPKESSPSWQPAALEAQAVAARSYSVAGRTARAGLVWHLCDSIYCQVYAGRAVTRPGGAPTVQEDVRTTAAVDRTRSAVRTYGGKVVRAEFSASNGGWSTSGGAAWLPARPDPWDGVVAHSAHTWRVDVPARTLELRYGFSRLDELRVLSRDGNGTWGGRVLDVELRGAGPTGAALSVRTSGDAIRSAAGLRSAWFRPLRPSPAELSRGAFTSVPGTVELLARTATGAAAAQTWTSAAGLSAPVSLGGALRGGPAVAARPGGQLEAFARGTDDLLYTSVRSGPGSWSAWRRLGGVLSGRPAVAPVGDQLHVFAAGADGALWHRSSTAPGTWAAWEPLGGRLAPSSGPAAVSSGPGRLDVVVRGTDGAAWRRTYANGRWSGWSGLGGRLAGDPALASAAGELTLVVRGTDGAGWTRSATTGWAALGGRLASDPSAAAVRGSGRLDVFATGTDGLLHRTTRMPAGWSGWTPVS